MYLTCTLDLKIGQMLDKQFSNVSSLAQDGVVKCYLLFVILNMEEKQGSVHGAQQNNA
jgi:hypothetical protein